MFSFLSALEVGDSPVESTWKCPGNLLRTTEVLISKWKFTSQLYQGSFIPSLLNRHTHFSRVPPNLASGYIGSVPGTPRLSAAALALRSGLGLSSPSPRDLHTSISHTRPREDSEPRLAKFPRPLTWESLGAAGRLREPSARWRGPRARQALATKTG